MEKGTNPTSEEVQIIRGLLTLKETLLQGNNRSFHCKMYERHLHFKATAKCSYKVLDILYGLLPITFSVSKLQHPLQPNSTNCSQLRVQLQPSPRMDTSAPSPSPPAFVPALSFPPISLSRTLLWGYLIPLHG